MMMNDVMLLQLAAAGRMLNCRSNFNDQTSHTNMAWSHIVLGISVSVHPSITQHTEVLILFMSGQMAHMPNSHRSSRASATHTYQLTRGYSVQSRQTRYDGGAGKVHCLTHI